MSRSHNFRVRGPSGSVVVKSGARPAEARFYQTVMPVLADRGLAIPEPRWLNCDGEGVWWLVLEDIPQLLPRERWYADREVLTTLRRLHAVPLSRALATPEEGFFRPRWTEEMNEAALSGFAEKSADLSSILSEMREEHQHLFLTRCPISGDPNPTNWGLRADGSLVLYDWERFGAGTPALDLAITIPGLGDKILFSRVASVYLHANPANEEGAVDERTDEPPSPPGQLAHEIAAAKVWSVVEFLSMAATGTIASTSVVDDLLCELPGWVRSLHDP